MTHSPSSSSTAEPAIRSHGDAAAFDPLLAPPDWLGDNARLAIAFPPARIVEASPAMLALFGVEDVEALEARLVRGEGPSARRLRHLAATLPVGGPARLEGMRFVVDRRPMSVNFCCSRIAAPDGATWLLVSVPALGAADAEPPRPAEESPAPAPEDPPAPNLGGPPPPNSRFLWTLDEAGQFGPADSLLAAAVGANAPRRGESVESLIRRAGVEARRRTRPRCWGAANVFWRRPLLAGFRIGSPAAGHSFGRAAIRPPARILGLSRLWLARRRDRRRAVEPGSGHASGRRSTRGSAARNRRSVRRRA